MNAVPRVEFELEDEIRVIVRDMLTITRATDLFLDDCSSRGFSQRTVKTYKRLLDKFAEIMPLDYDVGQIGEDDCRRYFQQFARKAPGTRAHAYSVMSSFFKWLSSTRKIKRNPMEFIARPKRLAPEDLDVLMLTSADVRKLIEMGETWPERIAINILAYLGPRRHAVSQLRVRDYDELRGRLRFREKGGKIIWKPVPTKLSGLLNAAIAAGIYDSAEIVEKNGQFAPTGADAYLIPSEGTLTEERANERDDRVIWNIVKRLAWRASIDATVHSLRAAFACFYLEQNPGDVLGAKTLLGHKSMQTTNVYLRKLDKGVQMERVRSLDWGDNTVPARLAQIAGERFDTSPDLGAGGFEPPFDGSSLSDSQGTQQ